MLLVNRFIFTHDITYNNNINNKGLCFINNLNFVSPYYYYI